ncbi:MAG: cysteine hydrolase [Thermoleophilia bacterium]|nr:cysteine hydrolase [Thermoleophilia bacterium]MDH4339293.1 cysteine hydrolase [Thermoleophilia bacterium]MDH5281203.1 cysteine hydrolase [Thermoleophilia bacterium]
MLALDARPAPLLVDPERTAVVVVDMQNDFGAPGGMFELAGIDISGITKAAAATGPVLGAARDVGIPVVYLKMEHAPDLSDVGPADGPHWIKHLPLRVGDEVVAPDGSTSRILVRGTWNTQILDVLTPEPRDHLVSKHRYSGFFETELDDVLRGLGAKYLLVTGCTTSVCVESTVRDAAFRDYSCIVLEDCTAEPIGAGLARTNHDASLLVVETLFGWISSSRVVCDALAQQVQLV